MTDQPTGEQAALARVERLALTFEVAGNEFIAERIRAAVTGVEPVPVVPVSSPPPDQTAEPVCKFEEGCHRVVPCDPGCAVAAAELHHRLAAVPPPPAGRVAVLREAADGFDRHAEQILEGVGDKAVFVAKALRDQAAVWREAAESLRRLAVEAQQPEAPWATDSARIGRVLIWSHAQVGRSDFGQGYRTAQEDVRAILTRPLLAAAAEAQQPEPESGCAHCGSSGHVWDNCEAYTALVRDEAPDAEPPAHIGGNADDCPACQAQGLHTIGHPYECPGPETAAETPAVGNTLDGSEEAHRRASRGA